MSYSFKTRAAAQAAANEVLLKIQAAFGPGWKTRVHENLGWHAGVRSKYVSVCFNADRAYYFTMISSEPNGSGMPMRWSPKSPETFKNPVKAVQAALDSLRKITEAEIRLVCAIEDSVVKRAPAKQQKGYREWLRSVEA